MSEEVGICTIFLGRCQASIWYGSIKVSKCCSLCDIENCEARCHNTKEKCGVYERAGQYERTKRKKKKEKPKQPETVVLKLDPKTGEVLATYPNAKAAARAEGRAHSNIINAINKHAKSGGFYYVKRLKDGEA